MNKSRHLLTGYSGRRLDKSGKIYPGTIFEIACLVELIAVFQKEYERY
jgi:hypothetical protein